MLTPKQRDLLVFIRDWIEANNGVSPTMDDMAKALGLKSKSGIGRVLDALKERGFISRIPHRTRSIEILRMPGEPSRDASQISERYREIAHLNQVNTDLRNAVAA